MEVGNNNEIDYEIDYDTDFGIEFKGHITAEFKFNVIDVFRCHFKMCNIAVLSFRKDKIVGQTITKPCKPSDINKQGFYTTIIPTSSMKEYDYDCNYEEVNVMVSSNLLLGNFKSKEVNLVSTEPLRPYDIPIEYRKKGVEVTFDLETKKKHKEDIKFFTELGVSFGVYRNEPYPHFFINSTLDYEIIEEDVMKLTETECLKSVSVDNPSTFRSFWTPNGKINIEKDNIIFSNCGGIPNIRARIGLVGNELELEVPSCHFKKLFKFMGSSNTNFEIIKPTKYSEFITHNKYFKTYASFGRYP